MAVKYFIKKSSHVYLTRVSVEPIVKTYTNQNYADESKCISHKYTCPICSSVDMHHQLIEKADHCPICGIYFNWDHINNKKELDDDESLYVG